MLTLANVPLQMRSRGGRNRSCRVRVLLARAPDSPAIKAASCCPGNTTILQNITGTVSIEHGCPLRIYAEHRFFSAGYQYLPRATKMKAWVVA